MMMAVGARRGRAGLAATVAVVLLSGCNGRATAPTAVTATSAALHAQTECLAQTTTNPCTAWFQYWADGSATVQSTPRVVANSRTPGFVDFTQTVTGLTPETLYHVQFCGYGDRNIAQPGLCVGPSGGSVTVPGVRPPAADHSATQNFRTASAGTAATVDIGRVLSTADTATNPIGRDGGHTPGGGPAQWTPDHTSAVSLVTGVEPWGAVATPGRTLAIY